MRRRGFTLIELLVVIAIIAILAAILFPLMVRAKRLARVATCASNMKQLATAMRWYASDWENRLPVWTLDQIDSEGYYKTWDRQIQPYMQSMDIIKCPSDSRSKMYNQNGLITRSYSYPGQLGGEWRGWILDSKTLSEIPSAAHTVILGERVHPWFDSAKVWHLDAVFDALGHNPDNTGDMGGEEVDWWRHEGIANFAFVDGHVKSYHGRPRTGTSPGVYPKFAGYTFNSSGAARCSYTDPLPTP